MLLWLDLEMTGLDVFRDQIIEIACLPTYFDLSPVLPVTSDALQGSALRSYPYEGTTVTPFHRVIHAPQALLDSMDAWCTSTHGGSGLTLEVSHSPHTLASVETELLRHLSQHYGLGRNTVYLAGNSIHQDRIFLSAQMPRFVKWLHYRQVDVSTVKLLVRNLSPQLTHLTRPPPQNTVDGGEREATAVHRAVDDMFASIAELKRYRGLFPSA